MIMSRYAKPRLEGKGSGYKDRVVWNDTMISMVYQLRHQGLSVGSISKRIGVDPGTFLRFRQANGIALELIPRSGHKLYMPPPHSDMQNNDRQQWLDGF
jgi:hypothetical protein